MRTPAAALRGRLGAFRPRLLLTLGSGLGAVADDLSHPTVIGFDEVGLPATTVPGHPGRLLAGELHGVPALVQQGRLHLYEGATAADVTACLRAAAAAGVDTLVVTNAAGGIAPGLRPGDLLVLIDHLNLTGTSPLIQPGGRPRFVDLTDAYDPVLRRLAHSAAAEVGEQLVEAVYAGLLGPAYETPAEVRMLRTLGADAVGMSTVLEVIAARALGLRVLGLSLVTNVHSPARPASPAQPGPVRADRADHADRAGTVSPTRAPIDHSAVLDAAQARRRAARGRAARATGPPARARRASGALSRRLPGGRSLTLRAAAPARPARSAWLDGRRRRKVLHGRRPTVRILGKGCPPSR